MRHFASEFLLPLVRGGSLNVGRPLGMPGIEALVRDLPEIDGSAVASLGSGRRLVASRFLPYATDPPCDETTVRLGAALHNLLALGHPAFSGPRAIRRQERIADVAAKLASVGPPPTAVEAANRHALLGRIPDIARVDRTVHFWLGRQAFVGRTPPSRVTALPGLRRVRIERTSRGWLREIGIPAAGRRGFLALNVASPLGEALDPLRLDPPLAWGRVLPVLRFPVLARAIAGRALEIGLEQAGDAFADALYRFAGFHDPPVGLPASPDAIAFALRFLAHLVWLDVLFGPTSTAKAAKSARSTSEPGPERATGRSGTGRAGVELAVVVTAAARARTALVWPADVSPESDSGRAFSRRLTELAARADSHGMPRFGTALAIAELAVAPVTLARGG